MTSQTASQPTSQDEAERQQKLRRELVAKATAIVPLLRANAQKAEETRRLPEENLEAMDAAGLFAIRAPRRFGGYEADLRTYVDVVAEIGRGCGSTGWIAFISDATNWIAALYPDEAQREVFDGNPGARFIGLLEPSATTKPVDGGLVVNGRWPFASNSLHAHWAILAVPVMNARGEVTDQAIAMMPMKELSVEETWFVAGMRGTGSNTVIAKDVFVPTRRVLPVGRLVTNDYPRTQHESEPVYRENFLLAAILAVVPPVLGVARAALDQTVANVKKGKKIYYTFHGDARQVPYVQYNLAQAAGLVDTAFLLTRHWADEVAARSRSNTPFDLITRTQARMAFGNAVRACRDAMELMMNINGASSYADASPMQRHWRDLEMASRHALISPETAQEMYGRALLGIDEHMTPLV